jgi:two-component system NarL family response regulator
MTPISILIADDHPLILAGLASLIHATPAFTLLGQARNGREAVERYARMRPDVLLMDLSMPELNGLEAIAQIRTIDDAAAIVILTTYQGDEDIYRGLRAGARGYLLKDGGFDQISACIMAVAKGQKYLPAEVASKLADRMEMDTLSRRELDILRHLATGQSNKMIARSVGIEVGTVKFHVNNILSKLNASCRTEAATVAARRGLLNLC